MLQERELIVHILPQIRFYYLKKDDVRLYGAVGIGGRYRKFTEDYENDPISNRDLKLTFQIIPFGMDVGNQWFFNMDIGDGLAWSYARIGMGYRF